MLDQAHTMLAATVKTFPYIAEVYISLAELLKLKGDKAAATEKVDHGFEDRPGEPKGDLLNILKN